MISTIFIFLPLPDPMKREHFGYPETTIISFIYTPIATFLSIFHPSALRSLSTFFTSNKHSILRAHCTFRTSPFPSPSPSPPRFPHSPFSVKPSIAHTPSPLLHGPSANTHSRSSAEYTSQCLPATWDPSPMR